LHSSTNSCSDNKATMSAGRWVWRISSWVYILEPTVLWMSATRVVSSAQ